SRRGWRGVEGKGRGQAPYSESPKKKKPRLPRLREIRDDPVTSIEPQYFSSVEDFLRPARAQAARLRLDRTAGPARPPAWLPSSPVAEPYGIRVVASGAPRRRPTRAYTVDRSWKRHHPSPKHCEQRASTLGAGGREPSPRLWKSVNNLERRPVLDREGSALLNHDLVRRDRRRRLGGLHISHRFGLGEHGK